MSTKGFDVSRARLLVDEISANLAVLPADSARYAELRAEVAAWVAVMVGRGVRVGSAGVSVGEQAAPNNMIRIIIEKE